MASSQEQPLSPGKWIWTKDTRKNHYVLFGRNIPVPADVAEIEITITASYHYELFVNGVFRNRGPVHGDPKWCSYDSVTVPVTGGTASVAVVVHYVTGTYLHYLVPSPPGLCAAVVIGDVRHGTNETWDACTLEMWKNDVPARGGALDYCEDYDARREPPGWDERLIPADPVRTGKAVLVEDADTVWSGYHKRIVPYIARRSIQPVAVTKWEMLSDGVSRPARTVYDISQFQDEEPLALLGTGDAAFPIEIGEGDIGRGFTFDLGAEYVGFYDIELDAPAGTVVEISGAELLQNADVPRPWIFRKGVCYSVLYTSRAGKQRFRTFSWNGFRYIHVVVRGSGAAAIHGVGCLERKAALGPAVGFSTPDAKLQEIYDLCLRTLEVGVLEHTVDCPTREQAPAWADSAIIAEGVYLAFGDRSYIDWYLEAYIRAPLDESGLICGRYPGTRGVWLDFCLIPLLVQRFYFDMFGEYYRPAETLEKALLLKQWYDSHLNSAGLVSFDFDSFYKNGFRTFIDHPGLGMHNAGHVGIDRDGTICGLNCFFYGFVRELAAMAATIGDNRAEPLAAQAAEMRTAIRNTFWDGAVYHDAQRLEWAEPGERLSAGTSWQTNSLAVYMGIAELAEAPGIMKSMLDGYETLCRCTPYTHFYFLPALHIAGMDAEARELIKREWGRMLEGGATTTWEGFLGDERDSLCHPWSTAPLWYLLYFQPE